MGASDVFTGRYFEGALADIAVFNRELTATEVSNLYAVANITINGLIDFDPLADDGAVVGGAALANYLAQFNVALVNNSPGTTVVAENQASVAGGGFVIASSPPNVLTQTGSNGPVSFTVNFTSPLSQFSFTRPELVANPLVSHPAWQAQAFDSLGIVLDEAQAGQISSSTTVPAQTYTLSGGSIASVEFSSEGTGLTTFNAMLLDDFVLQAGNAGNLPPSVLITSPASGQVFSGATAIAIAVETAAGSGTVTGVGFYYDGVLAGSASSSPFSLQGPLPANGVHVLTAVVTNSAGLTSTSAPVSFTVANGFAILTPPQSQTIGLGGKAAFSVTTTAANVTYQWRINGTNIFGANASFYTVNNASTNAAGKYTVVVTSGGQFIISPAAVLTVLGPPTLGTLSIVTNNGNITLSVSASDSVAYYYQWQLNGNGIAGATASNLTGHGGHFLHHHQCAAV